MSASGREWSKRKRCVISIIFCLWKPLPFVPFFVVSGRLANVRMLFRLIVSDTGTEASSNISLTYAACNVWPASRIRYRDVTMTCSMTFCVSRTISSRLVARNGLPSCSTTLMNDSTSFFETLVAGYVLLHAGWWLTMLTSNLHIVWYVNIFLTFIPLWQLSPEWNLRRWSLKRVEYGSYFYLGMGDLDCYSGIERCLACETYS